MNENRQLKDWSDERGISNLQSDRNGFVANITEELGEWLEAWDNSDTHEKVDALNDLVVFAKTEQLKLGYDPELTMQETIKEISSRTGAYSQEFKKWKKFTTPEAKALWYKANYTKCKLKEIK